MTASVEQWMAGVLAGSTPLGAVELPAPRDVIAAAAAAHGVTALLHRATGELAHEARRVTAVDITREAELERVFDSFERDGVRAVVMKGAALARTLYGTSALRARTDTDLLVADRCAAERTLAALGYTAIPNGVGELVIRQQLWRRTGRVFHDVDLHFAISNRARFAEALEFEELFSRGTAIRGSVRAIGHVDALVHAAIHAAGHHGDEERLIWYFDIHLLAQRLGDAGVRDALRFARERGCERELADALARTRAWFGGEPQPAVRRSASALQTIAGDLRAVKGIRRRAVLVKQHLVPSAAHVIRRYSVRRRSLLPLYYARRVFGALYREVIRVKMRGGFESPSKPRCKSKPIARWGRKA